MKSYYDSPLLHIGYGKTATTWFQKEFFSKLSAIEFYDHKRVLKTFGCNWQDIQVTDEVINIFGNSNKRLVISDEYMIGGFKEIEHNAQIFKRIFYPAQIVLFIRNQFDIYISLYSQHIRKGDTSKFSDFLFPEPGKIFYGKIYCYDKIISVYKEIFGEGNVFVYLYEEYAKDNIKFLNRFSSNHSLSFNSKRISFKRKNPGFSIPLLKAKRIGNYLTRTKPKSKKKSKYLLHIPLWYEFSHVVFDLLNKIMPHTKKLDIKDLIEPEKLQFFKDFFAASNNRLITEHRITEIEKYNYPL
jgi:hypothetical protein